MSRRPDRSIQVTDSEPSAASIIPSERDVITGLPTSFDHTDKSQQQSDPSQGATHHGSTHASRHQTSTGPATHSASTTTTAAAASGGGVSAVVAVGGVVALVAVIAGGIFLFSRTGAPAEDRAAPAAVVGSSSSPITSAPTTSGSPTAAASGPATAGSVTTAGQGALTPSPTAIVSSAAPSSTSTRTTVSGSGTRSRAGVSTGATPSGTRKAGDPTPALLPATTVGLDGTYRMDYRITAGKGTGTTAIGRTGSFTWVARRTCSATGCRTTIAGDIAPKSPGDAGSWSAEEFSDTVECRDNVTQELTGGSYPSRWVNSWKVTAREGTVVTAGTGTQVINQLALCPRQTTPLYSNTVTMTFRRTGP